MVSAIKFSREKVELINSPRNIGKIIQPFISLQCMIWMKYFPIKKYPGSTFDCQQKSKTFLENQST